MKAIRPFLLLSNGVLSSTSAQPLKYFLVGISGQAIDFTLTLALIHLHTSIILSNSLAYAVASSFAYVGHARLTFASSSRPLRSFTQILLFMLSCLIGATIGSILLVGLIYANISLQPAKLIQLFAIAVVQYLFNRTVTFAKIP
jgi:putative flippase GtrA